MKVNVNAEINGNEMISLFIAMLQKINVSAEPADVKILVKNKDNKEVELTPDRICLSYAKVQV